MRIGVIGLKGLPSQGGGERVGEAILRRLACRHQFTVYCDRNYTSPRDSIPGVELVRLLTFRGKHTRMLFLDLLAAAHALTRKRFDLIHVHNAETGFVNPFLRARFKIVGTVHTQAYTADKWGGVARRCMQLADYPFAWFADAVTCVSPLLVRRYGRFRPVTFIPNGVDLNPKISVEAATKTLSAAGAPAEGYILFAAGRIIPFKGCHLLLDAVEQAAINDPVVVVGDLTQNPEYAERLRRAAGKRVWFIPFVSSPAEILGMVQNARLFVFPSTNRFGLEGMSMMLLEVASLGTPLLASDIPQNTAVLGERGHYFRADDAGDLAQKLRWSLDHPTEVHDRAEDCRRHVRTQFSWDSIAAQYEAVFESVAGQTRPLVRELSHSLLRPPHSPQV